MTVMPLDRPADADIRAALDRVLASGTFARSERLRAFLLYVVTREIEGKASQLKGYTIAIDVFQRPDAFNADSDPLVRVHAGKLRKLLGTYYATEGADAAWQIDIPKGGYTPVYLRGGPSAADVRPRDEERAAAGPRAPAIAPAPQPPALPSPAPSSATSLASAPASPGPRVRGKRVGWLPAPLASPMAMISIVPLLLFAPLSSTALGVSPQVQARLSLSTQKPNIGLPQVTIRSEGGAEDPSTRLAGQIRAAMDYYAVIVPATHAGTSVVRQSETNALAFTISTAPATDGRQTRVTVTSDATGDVISELRIDNEQLSNDFDLLFEGLGVAAKTMATNGDLFLYAEAKRIASPLMHCMLMTDTYRRQKSRDALKEARHCQEQLLGKTKRAGEFIISAGELKKNVHP